MWDWIAFAEASAATLVASVAITTAVIFKRRADRLDIEVRQRVADIVHLSAAVDRYRPKHLAEAAAKPGPSRRAKDRETFVAMRSMRVAQLSGKVAG